MPYGMIELAIQLRQSLTGKYDNYMRFFSPHVLGDDREGHRALLGYQYAGGRPGGLPISGDWCFFLLSLLTDVRPNSDKWIIGPYGRPLHLFSKVDVQAGL